MRRQCSTALASAAVAVLLQSPGALADTLASPPLAPATASVKPSLAASPTGASALRSPIPPPSPSPSSYRLLSPSPSPASPPPTPRLLPPDVEARLLGSLGEAVRQADAVERTLSQAQAKEGVLAVEVLKAQERLAAIRQQRQSVLQEIEQLTARLQQAQHAYAALARLRYKQQRSLLAVFLEAGDFRDFVRRMGYLAVARDKEWDLVRQILADRDTLGHSAGRLSRLEQRAAADTEALIRARADLQRQQQQAQSLLRALQQSIAESLTLLTQEPPSDRTILRVRAELVLAQARARTLQAEATIWAEAAPLGPGVGAGSPSALITAQSLGALAGSGPAPLRWPVLSAILTQGFGPSPYSFEPAYASYPHFHNGLDLAAPLGTPVLSGADGIVLVATAQRTGERYTGYGNYVIVQHAAGLRTLYAHLLASVVKPGETVRQGQVLGFVGSTGNSTGPHTHFEARVENTAIDPLVLLPKR